MKKATAVWTLALLISFSSVAISKEHALRLARPLNLTRSGRVEAPPQSAQSLQ
jgi:hypothetical protein